jgi:hypothetical protein|tara:strand:- start:715 stop:1131 length:417 start_codon:yes stop_codon:yes gene_type:complete
MTFNNYRPIAFNSTRDVADKAKTLYYSALSRSKKHDIEFDLDVNWLINNLKSLRCQFTGIPLTLNYTGSSKVKSNSASVHRLIPELGYVKSNCTIIANSVNMFISNHDITEITPIAEAIVNSTEKIFLNYKITNYVKK